MPYTRHATDIVAYTFKAETYCPDCIIDAVTAQPEYDGWALADGVSMSTEDNLSEIAHAFSIDRMHESTYDSDEFPKVIFDCQVEDIEHCAACGEEL